MNECASFNCCIYSSMAFPFSIDLSGKMLTFPKETDTDHVKLMTPKTRFQAVTACVRFL